MSYLRFNSAAEGIERSAYQAFKRGCQAPVTHWWPEPIAVNGLWYMDVSFGKDDGGVWLTEEETTRVIDELPTQNP